MNHTTQDTGIFKVVRQCLHPPLTLWGHTHTRNQIAKHTHTHTNTRSSDQLHTHTRRALYREHTHCSSQIKYTQDHAPSYARNKWTEESKSKRLIWMFPLFPMTLLLRQCCKAAGLIFQKRIGVGKMQDSGLQALGSSSCHSGGLSSLNPLLGLRRKLFYLYSSS